MYKRQELFRSLSACRKEFFDTLITPRPDSGRGVISHDTIYFFSWLIWYSSFAAPRRVSGSLPSGSCLLYTSHAYAYLTFKRGKVLTEVAEKRLNAIRDYAEFGSGFKIAMRDLEIRGAGNLLGSAQSGHMLSVGYDLHLKLLEEAVLEERGEKPAEEVACTADLDVTANIDKQYVASGEQRMDLYRRMAFLLYTSRCV